MTTMTLEELAADCNWREAFAYANAPQPTEGYAGPLAAVTLADVAEVVAYDDGENDGPDWVGVFRLHDGRHLFLAAGCDYTGWDCQAGGSSWLANDLASCVRWGLTTEARERLGYA